MSLGLGVGDENLMQAPNKGIRVALPLALSCGNRQFNLLDDDIAEKQKVERKSSRQHIELEPMPVPPNIEDIDVDDKEYLEFCPDYVKKIYDHLFESERQNPVKANYLKRHPELRPAMRAILIQWLVSLRARFKLLQDTLLLTVSILDRFLSTSKSRIPRSKFQLLGATCMWVASKYEEIYLPSVDEFVYMCDNAFTRTDFQLMEIRILNSLNFEFAKPLSSHFLRRFSKAGGSDSKTHQAAKYLIELSLYCYELVDEHPSKIAAAALFVAGKLTGKVEWDQTAQFYSRYAPDELKSVAMTLAQKAASASSETVLKGTVKRYSVDKFYLVTNLFDSGRIPQLFAG